MELEPVELTWYFPNTPQPDQDTVTAAINEILNEKINASVTVHNIDWGAYEQKIQLMIASGEEFDVCYSASWINHYVPNVNKGAFFALDEMIEKYATNYTSTVPQALLDAAKINGQSYGIAPLQVLGQGFDFTGSMPLFEKYGYNPEDMETLEDFTPFLEAVAAGEPDIYPVTNRSSGIFNEAYYDMETFGVETCSVVYMNDEDLTVHNVYETPEFKEHVELMRQWNLKGFFRKDAATFDDLLTDLKSRKYAIYFTTVNPDTPANQAQYFSEDGNPEDVAVGYLTPKLMTQSQLMVSYNSISVNSQNPERAVMMLDLFFDQEDTRLQNLMQYGVEDIHYSKVEDDLIAQIENSGYWLDSGWEHGDIFTCFRTKPVQPSWDVGREMNETAIKSTLVGFSFDPTSVETEIAQCSAVLDEYRPGLVTGAIDPEEYLPKLQEKLKGAGVDTIVAEIQRQIDEWKAGN
jgi:putative aldouronate transport system substrate-binding protein